MAQFNPSDPHAGQSILYTGAKPENALAGMIMLHGRGAGAEDIISLTSEFINQDRIIFAAPQAANDTWYPYSFLTERKLNEPGISSGLNVIAGLLNSFIGNGLPIEKIILLGFSQGACLTLEFAARNPLNYGGIIGLSGGLIGDYLDEQTFQGNLQGSPVFLGCSDIDPHIPAERVNETERIFMKLNGNVTKRLYENMGHTVNQGETMQVNSIISTLLL